MSCLTHHSPEPEQDHGHLGTIGDVAPAKGDPPKGRVTPSTTYRDSKTGTMIDSRPSNTGRTDFLGNNALGTDYPNRFPSDAPRVAPFEVGRANCRTARRLHPVTRPSRVGSAAFDLRQAAAVGGLWRDEAG